MLGSERKEIDVAELTNLESKLAEVLGLAMASKGTTEKVKGLVEDEDLKRQLQQMHDDAAQLEERCTEVAGELDGKKTAILEKARETRQEADEMMSAYLGDGADGLDGFEFMTMPEAGEVGHWAIVKKMNERAGIGSVAELAEWALPLQQRHFDLTLEASLKLAAQEDPNATE